MVNVAKLKNGKNTANNETKVASEGKDTTKEAVVKNITPVLTESDEKPTNQNISSLQMKKSEKQGEQDVTTSINEEWIDVKFLKVMTFVFIYLCLNLLLVFSLFDKLTNQKEAVEAKVTTMQMLIKDIEKDRAEKNEEVNKLTEFKNKVNSYGCFAANWDFVKNGKKVVEKKNVYQCKDGEWLISSKN